MNNLGSFRAFRGPLFPKLSILTGTFFLPLFFCDTKGVSVYEIVGLFLKEEIHDSFAFRVVRGKLQKWINRSPKIVSLWTSAKTVEVESLCDFNETIQKTVPVPG